MAGDIIKASMQVLLKPWVASCEETRERLSDHLDGELRGREHKRVLRHLVRCPHCRAMLKSLTRTLAHLRSLGQVEVFTPAAVQTADVVIERIRRDRL